MARSISMKDIAAAAGVTQATVSLSLAGNPRIPASTRERVRAVADRLGYRPHPLVSALMRSRRTRSSEEGRPTIALVNGLETEEAWRTSVAPTVRQMRIGALERAHQRGYRIEEFWLNRPGMSARRFAEMLAARGIAGLLLGPLLPGAAPPPLPWAQFAAVRLGFPLPELTLTSVCNDHHLSCFQLLRESHRLGYRRPGLVLLDFHRERFQGRWEGGFLLARHLLPGLRPVPPLRLGSWDDTPSLGAWIRRSRPDLVVASTVDPLQAHLTASGVRIPEELGFASLACPTPGHACSGIWQNGALLGSTAVDQIIGMLEANVRGLPEQARVIMVEGIWNPGSTLSARARTPSRAQRPPSRSVSE
jgi:DNA-binding LacI/PurR family transcriptional regulator